jgi:hypothetical protein
MAGPERRDNRWVFKMILVYLCSYFRIYGFSVKLVTLVSHKFVPISACKNQIDGSPICDGTPKN